MGKLLAEAGTTADRVRAELGPGSAGPVTTGLPPHLIPRRRGVPWRLLFLLAVPVSIVLGYVVHAPAVWVFFTACLGVLPLAGLMGEATEHLAHRTGPTIGGLLNATFGNAAELIIAIVALRAGLVELVKASITGSILGNLLLILGLALIAGGTNRQELRFNRTNAGMSAGMLALSVVALVFPALFHSVHPEAAARMSELHMSEAVAVILILTYCFSLLFTLRTHRMLFGGEAHPMAGPVWGAGKAVAILAAATVGVAIESELLVHAATEATEALGLSTMFLGLIVIPIIGNAAEHAAAVMLSRKGQIDLGLQIALGSSTQIALLVAPLLVFAGVLLGQDMNLVFRPFEVVALGLATIVVAIITLDGESHWFEGVQLLAVYAMVAVGAFFL
ncbi:MAG TPA: calcium/proton exchanger, partial [Gemmatimonadales bacterium]|nr:calcium/proton exchanger [Gemmatimonadales bacterium]